MSTPPEYEHVFSQLRGVVDAPNPNMWRAFCPYHKGGNERKRSLSLWIGRDGRLMISCWTCGRQTKNDILNAIGLTMSDLFPDHDERPAYDPRAPTPRRQVVERYNYTDENGNTIYQVWRYEPKGFGQFLWHEGEKRFIPGLMNCRRVLYQLPDIRASGNRTIFVVEGERKADVLRSHGFIATCNVGGAGMGWLDCYSQSLIGKNVAVIPDNDPPGYRHADHIAGSLVRHHANSVRMVVLPGLPEKGDIIDWLKLGKSIGDLVMLSSDSPCWRPISP